MGSHPLANENTYQHIDSVINGAAPLSNSDVERFIDKVKVGLLYIFLIIHPNPNYIWDDKNIVDGEDKT